MFDSFRVLMAQQWQLMFRDKERFVSPFIFALTILLLFTFASGDTGPDVRVEHFASQTFLTILFSVQIALYRTIEPEKEDRIFDMLRLLPTQSSAWFCARCFMSVLICLSIALPVVLLGFLFHPDLLPMCFNVHFWILLFLVCFGLSVLGSLLSILTFHADGREVLFPMLFFPLSIPVLLTGLAGTASLQGEEIVSWIGLVGGFDVIYFTLGVLLFDEFVRPS